MKRSPYLEDPLEQMSKHIAAAVVSPIEEARAMHIRAADHLSQLAKESGLTAPPKAKSHSKKPGGSVRTIAEATLASGN
jgi:hypothetical protein